MTVQRDKKSPRLIRRGDIVDVRDQPGDTRAIVTGISVVLNLSNGIQQVHQLDQPVTVITELDEDDELAIQAAEMLSRED